MAEEKKKILIVEDEKPLSQALVDKLTHEGFLTLTAKNGEEGLEVALREHPDLILLDIIMPVMNGMIMMKKLREESVYGKNVPVILLTNVSADQEEINKSISINEPAYYLVKSEFTLQNLVKKIRERLS